MGWEGNIEYNYGTALNKLITYYKEMLDLITQARLASDRIDEWKETLYIVINPDQTNEATKITNAYQYYKDYL